jgi:hypothetical protein
MSCVEGERLKRELAVALREIPSPPYMVEQRLKNVALRKEARRAKQRIYDHRLGCRICRPESKVQTPWRVA